MKNIFVSKNIAKQLKEISFDEPCMAFYQDYEGFNELYVNNFETDESVSVLTDTVFVANHNIGEHEISAPTWEQVFKWFRDKNFRGSVEQKVAGDFGFVIYVKNVENPAGNPWKRISYFTKHFETYEQARENLILELIKIYKNQKLC